MQPAPTHLRPKPHDGISRRDARLIAWLGYLAAITGPAILWREPIALIATDFRFEFQYLVMGWTGYFLIIAGLLFLMPVLISVGRFPEDRLYPRSRNAYIGWGFTLYLLGCAIATQVAQIASGPGET